MWYNTLIMIVKIEWFKYKIKNHINIFTWLFFVLLLAKKKHNDKSHAEITHNRDTVPDESIQTNLNGALGCPEQGAEANIWAWKAGGGTIHHGAL
jgi:hypothetical protein